jgi:hypothetical protein
MPLKRNLRSPHVGFEGWLKVSALVGVIYWISRFMVIKYRAEKAERELYVMKIEEKISDEKTKIRSLNPLGLLKYVNERRRGRRLPPDK